MSDFEPFAVFVEIPKSHPFIFETHSLESANEVRDSIGAFIAHLAPFGIIDQKQIPEDARVLVYKLGEDEIYKPINN